MVNPTSVNPNHPVVSEPVASEPVASEPAASQPAAFQPAASESPASEPATSESTSQASHAHAPGPGVGHPMTTRAKDGIFKPKHRADLAHTNSHGLFSALFASKDPKGFQNASKHPHWMTAMHQEMDALHRNNTWTLVPRPERQNVVGCRWLFRTKYHVDGSIKRHKARLAAQGFS